MLQTDKTTKQETTANKKPPINEFLEALRHRGMNPTPQECRYLQDIAVKQYKRERVRPLFKQDKWHHYICLLMGWLGATHEVMFWIDKSSKKQKLKREFNTLNNNLKHTLDEFLKVNKDNKELLSALEIYTQDLMEMMHIHLETVNKKP